MDSNHTPTHPEPDEERNAGLPPRGQLFSDPAAGAVWAAIISLDPALQHDILRELQLRLAVTASSPGDLRIERAIAALREAAETLGRSPSVEDYRRLRAENPHFSWGRSRSAPNSS